MSHSEYFIGLMSGTSMDGIDAALVAFQGEQPQLLHSLSHPWPEALKTGLMQLAGNGVINLQELGQLDIRCGEQFAIAACRLMEEAGMTKGGIHAIGSHGQTVCHHPHHPAPFSLQIGDPNTIAERTGTTVVADFRRRDMAAGGQGAPLVPAFHQTVFAHPQRNRVILNIGGIANITILPANGKVSGGFDTGPGNCLMDRWTQENTGRCFDRNGDWARSGKVQEPLLQHFLNDEYFSLAPPKSTGTEYFSWNWLRQKLRDHPKLAAQDIQATLLQLTCDAILHAIQQWAPDTEEVLVCGGGVHNNTLTDALSQQLHPVLVTPTNHSAAAIDPDWVEAMAFAWLARQTLRGKPGNIPAVTGASRPVIAGGIYPAPLLRS
ncbi:anhydro-N-acetylmuramic acid kinase [Thiolapillus sp.]